MVLAGKRLSAFGIDGLHALVALCQFLPGPASTQMVFALGSRRAGFLGGLVATFCFTAPSALVMILFALSLDLVVGYAGLVTLGHGAFFGLGAYTAGILAARGHTEALSGLAAAAVVAGLAGLLSGAVMV